MLDSVPGSSNASSSCHQGTRAWFVFTSAAGWSHIFLMLQVTQGTCWIQQLSRTCPLLHLLGDFSLGRMQTLSPPYNQEAKQLLDRGEGLCVILASSP